MNPEIKALVQMVLDLYAAGKNAVAKANFVTVVLPQLYKVASDLPGVLSNWSDLGNELAGLKGSSAEADLVALIQQVIPEVTSDAKAQAVALAVVQLLADVGKDVVALEQALSMQEPAPVAPAAAPATPTPAPVAGT